MKKIALILTTILIFHVSIHGQTWETIGSGVADFLLSNPKTADKMKPEHQVALGIIGDLLKTSGQRKHELNVAEAGRTQMNFNTNSGQQIQLVMDANGNVYALSNGIIYPISQSIVNEAKEFVLNQRSGYMDYIKDTPTSNSKFMLPNFNINNLEYEWKKAQMYNFENIRSEKKIPIGDFVNLYGDNIYIFRKGKFEQIMETRFAVFFSEKIIRKNKMKIHSDNGILIIGNRYYLFTKFLKNQMRGSFTARWVKDFNNDGSYQFNEYEDKRRNFYENESFLIVARFTSPNQYSMKLSILNQLSGETVFSNKLENLGKEYDQGYFNINSFFFKPGIYSYYISFINTNTNEIMDNISDKFQILALNQTNEDKNITTPPINQDTEKSSSKEDMINELIQLLKDGKISEETFKASMKALEEK